MKDAAGNEIPGTPPEGTPPPVPLENQLAEANRKLGEAQSRAEQLQRDADMLREQQLRMMAQTPPPAAAPQAPEESDEELGNLMATSPVEAVRKIVAREKKGIDVMVEQRARHIFLIESKKAEAVSKYPDLRNPNSEFFRRVAYHMDTHPGKYNDPEGILDACARVQVEMGVPASPGVASANETVRQAVTSGAAQVAGAGTAPATEGPELDAKGLELAAKLGIDPKNMAARLKNYTDQTGEYAPKPGKTGKASI